MPPSWRSVVAEGGGRPRARRFLQTGSFISGQLFVALQNFPNAPKATIDCSVDPPEFPTIPGGLASFEDKILTILTKIEKLPIDDLSRDVKKVLATLDQGLQDVTRMVNRVDGEVVPEVKKTLGTLDRTLQDADKMLVRVDGEIVPGVKKTLEDLQGAVIGAQRVLANTDSALLGPVAPAQLGLRDALQGIGPAQRLRILRQLAMTEPWDYDAQRLR